MLRLLRPPADPQRREWWWLAWVALLAAGLLVAGLWLEHQRVAARERVLLAKQAGVSNLKTVLRFNQAELFLALNKETPDEVVQKLQTTLEQMRQEGFVDKAINSYLQ